MRINVEHARPASYTYREQCRRGGPPTAVPAAAQCPSPPAADDSRARRYLRIHPRCRRPNHISSKASELPSTMAAKFVVLVACLALAHGHVRRDAPASTPLEDISKHAADFQKVFAESLDSLVNSKNSQDLQKAYKDGSEQVLQQISAFSAGLQDAISDANGKAKEQLESARAQLERNVQELRKAHPEVEQHASALKEKLQSAVQNTVQEAQKLAKEISANVETTNQKLGPKLKSAYDDFVKQAEAVQKKLHEVATKQ